MPRLGLAWGLAFGSAIRPVPYVMKVEGNSEIEGRTRAPRRAQASSQVAFRRMARMIAAHAPSANPKANVARRSAFSIFSPTQIAGTLPCAPDPRCWDRCFCHACRGGTRYDVLFR